jgi:hypothetical protein
MNAEKKWTPKHIDIEPSFNEFVLAFRGGRLIRDLMPDASKMPLNADYLFPNDNIIAELKCLEKNPVDGPDWQSRVVRAFQSTGYSFDDLMECVDHGKSVPAPVRAKLIHWLRQALRGVVKAGNRQLRQSKRDLKRADAKGVLLIANDNHYGFAPDALLALISDGVALLKDNHVDALVYFTPNVFHRREGSDVAWVLWEPRYRDDTDDGLAEFVNDLGRKWNDYTEVLTGDPFVERNKLPSTNASLMKPVRKLGRHDVLK